MFVQLASQCTALLPSVWAGAQLCPSHLLQHWTDPTCSLLPVPPSVRIFDLRSSELVGSTQHTRSRLAGACPLSLPALPAGLAFPCFVCPHSLSPSLLCLSPAHALLTPPILPKRHVQAWWLSRAARRTSWCWATHPLSWRSWTAECSGGWVG